MSQNVQGHRGPHPSTGGHVSELANGLNQSAPNSTAQISRAEDARYSPQAQANFATPPVSSSRSLPPQPVYSSTLTSYESAAAAANSSPSQPHLHVHSQQQPQLHHAYHPSAVQVPVFPGAPIFFQQQQQQQQHSQPVPSQQPPPQPNSSDASANASPVQTSSPSKRKFDESRIEDIGTSKGGNKTVRKRRMRVSINSTGGTDEVKDDVGSSVSVAKESRGEGGGAKHWTDEEKGKLFIWMLGSDENWAAFANQMNSVFREASQVLFNNTKSFTALKSCYHRNVETFKQISAFTQFLISSISPNPEAANAADLNNPSHDILTAPIPSSFQSGIHRQTFLERKLEAGRSVAGIPVANLNIKVVDHWYRLGWYELFRRRYRFDPVQNTVVPYHGPDPAPPDPLAHIFPLPPPNFPPPIHTLIAAPSQPDQVPGPLGVLDQQGSVQGEDQEEDAGRDGLHEEDDEQEGGGDERVSIAQSQRASSSSARSQRRTATTTTAIQVQNTNGPQQAPAPPIGYAYPYAPPHTAESNSHTQYFASAGYKPSPYVPPLPPPSQSQVQVQAQAQTQQSPQHLVSLTQTLITSCNTLTELLRTHVEEGKALRELVKRLDERENRREEAEKAGNALPGIENMPGKDKAAFAKEMLSSPDVSEEVKQAAATYLKRLFQ